LQISALQLMTCGVGRSESRKPPTSHVKEIEYDENEAEPKVMKPKSKSQAEKATDVALMQEKMTLAENDPASLLEGEVEDLTVTADLISAETDLCEDDDRGF